MLETIDKETKSDRKITRSIAFMSRHLAEPVKVAQLAKRANFSPSYFWALFKQQTGHAPVDFLIRLRMHQACHLLNTTNMTVKQVATALGYKDPFYFSRVFKSFSGAAPTHYRERSSREPLLPELDLQAESSRE